MTANLIQASNIEGKTYYTAIARGVEYTACESKVTNNWFVYTRRLALGRSNMGGVRYYESVEALAANCKAFAGLDVLLAAEAL